MELVDTVNKFLTDGGTISGFERAHGYGKDTVRKRLKSLGFTYSKEIKQFILTEVKQEVRKSLTPTLNVVNQTAIPFNEDEIEILKQLIVLQKSKNKLEFEREDNPIVFAGLKCGEKTLNQFKQFCKDRNIKQQDAVTMALELFMQQFK